MMSTAAAIRQIVMTGSLWWETCISFPMANAIPRSAATCQR